MRNLWLLPSNRKSIKYFARQNSITINSEEVKLSILSCIKILHTSSIALLSNNSGNTLLLIKTSLFIPSIFIIIITFSPKSQNQRCYLILQSQKTAKNTTLKFIYHSLQQHLLFNPKQSLGHQLVHRPQLYVMDHLLSISSKFQ